MTSGLRILGPGDDTVPLRSLSLCASWPSSVEVKTFVNLDHMLMLGAPEFNAYFKEVLRAEGRLDSRSGQTTRPFQVEESSSAQRKSDRRADAKKGEGNLTPATNASSLRSAEA